MTLSAVSVSPETLAQAVCILQQGGLVGMPTETVYGLACDASNEKALKRLFEVKGRPSWHPVIVHLAGPEQLFYWTTRVTKPVLRLAEAFWPGPLTMVLPRSPQVPDLVTGGQATVGLRVPNHPVALALLAQFGGGIAAPSANRFGRVSPTTAAHVHADLAADIDLVLDGGACEVGVESTIVDMTGEIPVILRPGMISADQIAAVLGIPVDAMMQSSAVHTSGQIKSHYAPNKPVVLMPSGQLASQVKEAKVQGRSVGVMSLTVSVEDPDICMPAEPEAYARDLYATLRTLDEMPIDAILIETPPEHPAWQAIHDRLRRAAHPKTRTHDLSLNLEGESL